MWCVQMLEITFLNQVSFPVDEFILASFIPQNLQVRLSVTIIFMFILSNFSVVILRIV